MSFKRRTRILALTAAAVALMLVPATAHAEEATSPMQRHIDAVIAEFGGEQTGWNEVTWDGGDRILTVAPQDVGMGPESFAIQPLAVGSCATGYHCVFSGSDLGGSRYSFGTCAKNQSLAPLGRPVKSVANARSSGLVFAYNGYVLLATVPTGEYRNVSTSTNQVTCM